MTEEQKETLRFYTTNQYLLLNGLLWGESDEKIDAFIRLINEDGRGVMAEAVKQGFSVRWKCGEEEGKRLYRVYQRRFPVLDGQGTKDRILETARRDISNLFAALAPLETEMVLYRNIKTRYAERLKEGTTFSHLGFSSCSLSPHVAENAEYGSSGCRLAEIVVPSGFPAIRLDLMPDVQNEPDEVILAPAEYSVSAIDPESGKLFLTCVKPLN